MSQYIIHSPDSGGLITHTNIDSDRLQNISTNHEIYDSKADFEQRVEELTPDGVTLPDAVG